MNQRTTIRTAIIIGTSVIAALAVGVWRGISFAPVEYAPTGTQKMKAHHHSASHRDPERRQRGVQAGREDPADSPVPSGPAPPEPVDRRLSLADEDALPFESVKNMLRACEKIKSHFRGC
jgi:hypothetical protein